MENKNIFVIAKAFDAIGCIAYKCKSINEARCLPGTLEAISANGVQIVTLNDPEIYAEYAPYEYISELTEFIDCVKEINKIA